MLRLIHKLGNITLYVLPSLRYCVIALICMYCRELQ